jgi:hypothetical protein
MSRIDSRIYVAFALAGAALLFMQSAWAQGTIRIPTPTVHVPTPTIHVPAPEISVGTPNLGDRERLYDKNSKTNSNKAGGTYGMTSPGKTKTGGAGTGPITPILDAPSLGPVEEQPQPGTVTITGVGPGPGIPTGLPTTNSGSAQYTIGGPSTGVGSPMLNAPSLGPVEEPPQPGTVTIIGVGPGPGIPTGLPTTNSGSAPYTIGGPSTGVGSPMLNAPSLGSVEEHPQPSTLTPVGVGTLTGVPPTPSSPVVVGINKSTHPPSPVLANSPGPNYPQGVTFGGSTDNPTVTIDGVTMPLKSVPPQVVQEAEDDALKGQPMMWLNGKLVPQTPANEQAAKQQYQATACDGPCKNAPVDSSTAGLGAQQTKTNGPVSLERRQ